jgi:hypothetical protein
MYAAACAVLLCGLGAYVSTYEGFGGGAVLVVLVGVCVSVFARLRRLRQDTMFGLLAAIVVVLIFWVSATGGGASLSALGILGDRNNFPGVLLAWFVMLYSFAMITDEVIIFSIVPSIALLGTMASDNLNADIVVYFMGLVMSAVFLLVYENMLSRGVFDRPAGAKATHANETGVRTSLLMTALVVASALVVGFVGSRPLAAIGETVRARTPDMDISTNSRFASEVTQRYINEMDLSGNPPRLSDRVIMRVQSPRPLYWRGKVFSVYTGNSWTAGEVSDTPRQLADGLWSYSDLKPEPDSGELLGRTPVLQHFELEDPPIGRVLVAAGEGRRIYLRPPERIRSYGARIAEDKAARTMLMNSGRGGRYYTVLSDVPDASPADLRAASTNFPAAMMITNTHLGGEPNAERHAIAVQVTAGAKTQYDKVKALEEYLQSNFSYTLTPPRTPSSVDAVTYFLTHTKQGYCEIFASSMAVLCRELGIPARLATGFAPGEWMPGETTSGAQFAQALDLSPQEAEVATRDGRLGTSVVRERDLHAWTEVYFPGYGWVPFDPTASREAETAWGTSFTELVRNLWIRLGQAATGSTLVLLGMAAIAAFLLKTYGLDTLRSSAWWRAAFLSRRKSIPARARWDWLYARSHRRLKRAVGPKSAGQTPYEYADQARARLTPEAAAAFDALTKHYVRHAFRRAEPTEDDIAALLALDQALAQALRKQGSAKPLEATALAP